MDPLRSNPSESTRQGGSARLCQKGYGFLSARPYNEDAVPIESLSMKVACYLRSRSSGGNPDRQRDELLRRLQQGGYDPGEIEWYSDQAQSTAPDRPGLVRLQREILDGKVKEVVLWKLGHVSRRVSDLAATLAAWCERGIKVVVVADEIVLSAAAGQEVSALLRGLSKTELEFRRNRQKAGIAAARKRGVYLGRKSGTTKGKPTQAQELKKDGLTTKEIAEKLGVSERTVFRYLGTSEGK
jgi:DNA invertase Pin-like site-specific DNA recombinase